MKRIKLLRFIPIRFILIKYGLNSAMLFLKIRSPLRLLNSLNPRNWVQKKTRASNEAPSLSLNDFKPLFSELSKTFANQDLHPETIVQEFNSLKNKISPIISKKNGVIIEQYNEPSPFQPEAPIDISLKTEELGQHIKKFWSELNIAQFSGENGIHQIDSLVNRGIELKKHFTESKHHNIATYLEEGLRVFPSRNERNDFFNKIDDLSLSVERLQAHVNQLMSAHETN